MGQTQDRQTGSTERGRSKTRLIQLGTGNGEMVGWAQGKTLRGLRSRTPLNPFKVVGSSGSHSSAGISILACSFCYFHSLAFFLTFNVFIFVLTWSNQPVKLICLPYWPLCPVRASGSSISVYPARQK